MALGCIGNTENKYHTRLVLWSV